MHAINRPRIALALAASLAACSHTNPITPIIADVAQPSPPTPASVAPPPIDEQKAIADNQVQIPFIEGGSKLTVAGLYQLEIAARLFRDAGPALMYASGYADSTGDDYRNILLSAKRAQVVKEGLVARGIPADHLLIQAFGQSEPVDNSNPASPENRRVVVTWKLHV